eukprot:TRINITY_DN781_c0_g2_i1.p1 TRINITY_DN781_c0_g2~~TRINITY_DN781_c0_g2_i1.p1  ORF type:complete len:206 (+),score=44.75 TRINITY_DN781_c0_g2_i1:120-737(+)
MSPAAGAAQTQQSLFDAIAPYYLAERDDAVTLIYFGLFFIFIGYWVIGSEARVECFLARSKRNTLPNTRWWNFQKWLYDWYRPAAYPLIAVGFVEVVMGSITYLRTDLQIRLTTELFTKSLADFLTSEQTRMQTILFFYRISTKVELVAIVATTVGLILPPLRRIKPVYALCVGILPQAAALFWNNTRVVQRAELYSAALSTAAS